MNSKASIMSSGMAMILWAVSKVSNAFGHQLFHDQLWQHMMTAVLSRRPGGLLSVQSPMVCTMKRRDRVAYLIIHPSDSVNAESKPKHGSALLPLALIQVQSQCWPRGLLPLTTEDTDDISASCGPSIAQ
jgi:hypothetical protein